MTRYIIMTDGYTKKHQDALTAYLQNEKIEFWHYFKEVWLVADPQKKVSFEDLVKKTASIAPDKFSLVTFFTGSNGFGYGVYGPEQMKTWLRVHWVPQNAPPATTFTAAELDSSNRLIP